MRENLVFDILQYCKLLNFVKQNEFLFKLLMLKLQMDWGAAEQMLARGRLWPLSRLCFWLTSHTYWKANAIFPFC